MKPEGPPVPTLWQSTEVVSAGSTALGGGARPGIGARRHPRPREVLEKLNGGRGTGSTSQGVGSPGAREGAEGAGRWRPVRTAGKGRAALVGAEPQKDPWGPAGQPGPELRPH